MQERMAPAPFSWDDLQSFLALYRARTVTGAARALQLDQSTMSRRLLTLERAMGARLFDRVPGGLAPTALADAVVGHAETAEQSAQAFAHAVTGADQRLTGTVRVALPDGVDSEVVARRFPEFQALHPGLTIELIASPQVANLARREADLALRMVRPVRGELVMKKVTQLSMSVWAHQRLVKAHGKHLGRYPWVTWDDSEGGAAELKFLEAVAPGAQIALRTNRTEARAMAVSVGVGAAILPDVMAQERVGLKRVPAPPLPPLDVWLVGHKQLVQVPRVRVVWEWLETLASSMDQ